MCINIESFFIDCVNFQQAQPNYYWRYYQGVIPHDAVPGGYTSGGSTSYIGQLLVTDSEVDAILPSTIHVGQTEIQVPFYGIYKNKSYATVRKFSNLWFMLYFRYNYYYRYYAAIHLQH